MNGAELEAGCAHFRTGRSVFLRFRSVISPTLLSGRGGGGGGWVVGSGLVVVVELLLRLLGQESLELGAQLVAAGQVPVASQ